MKYAIRPYLVIPKLVEQPTWGGQYIIESKGWHKRDAYNNVKIGQSYELFSGSNLSLLPTSDDPSFDGELTNNIDVEIPTHPAGSIALADLVASNPVAILGQGVVAQRGDKLELLIKFTQALGNSFQVHMKDTMSHPTWKPKLESWYYFQPGVLTLGVKPDADWVAYEACVRAIDQAMSKLGAQMQRGELTHEQAKQASAKLLQQHNPWQYVNTITVKENDLVDLSHGGIHHSWEEDPAVAPLGNILIEVQTEAMDNISTFRSFDKGKIGADGAVRPVHIDPYFEVIDRSPEANDPNNHLPQPRTVQQTSAYHYDHLLDSIHFNLDRLILAQADAVYNEAIDRYKHIFIRSGAADITAGNITVRIGTGHACFVPAASGTMRIANAAPQSEVIISY